MDTVGREVRSRIMSRVKQRDSRLERQLRSRLWHTGLRYRKHVRMYGTPDIAIRSKKLVVFVDSCFWHGCRDHCRMPKSNVEFWATKIERNRQRDVEVTNFYRQRGWIVLRFWEHRLTCDLDGCVEEVRRAVAGMSGRSAAG